MSYSLAVANRTMHMRIVVLVPILLLCLEPAAFAATTTPTCTRELAAAETSLLKNARAPGQHRQGPSGRKMRRLPQTCRDRDQGARGVRPLHDEPGARDGYRSARRFPQGHLWRDRQELRRSVRTARKHALELFRRIPYLSKRHAKLVRINDEEVEFIGSYFPCFLERSPIPWQAPATAATPQRSVRLPF